ncbi:uncharacterized protein [Elaeis guineensis]|uniref:Uncharacterized protein LOC105058569 isoform X4 n=1 Tax=Elaeis guineensis var. tenera TaxID=51953 RepID=A0A6I9SB31_ELAGV|nr:uncharacterized protein LOC105058569 isoform X4 [Elaeis guineensis]
MASTVPAPLLFGLRVRGTLVQPLLHRPLPPPSALRAAGRRSSQEAPPRRLFLGLGAAFLDQFARMASGSGGHSFTASARPEQGVSPVEQVLKNVEWPEKFPFKDEDFARFDESPDSLFYSEPRFVTHIDDPAIRALTNYYSKVFPPSNSPGVCLLDLCSSWVSHYPAGYRQDRIVGMGMNEEELKRNPVLTEYIVQDLNVNPKLPFDDNTFDVITNVVSVDYLTKPIEVFKEMQRILKPGGLAIMRQLTYLPTPGVQIPCMLCILES